MDLFRRAIEDAANENVDCIFPSEVHECHTLYCGASLERSATICGAGTVTCTD